MHRWVLLMWCCFAVTAAAQQPVPPGADTTRADTAPAPPTPEQERYLQGLRTVGRGIAQLKDGLYSVLRADNLRDTTMLVTAGRRLGGLCAAARGFLTRGRAGMRFTAYDAPVRLPARELVARIDSLIAFAPACQRDAGRAPVTVKTELGARIAGYEGALRGFRAAIGLPNR